MSSPKGLPRIPEILRIICEHLHPDKAALVSLAGTCRIFEEPALDTLWCNLDGFYQLAKCLPNITWEEEDREDGNVYLVLKCPLASTDCMRLMQYARRVKTFTTDLESGTKRVHSSVYQGLQFALPDQILLPNIRRLTLRCTEDVDFAFSNMFLGPRLMHVEYAFSPKSSSQLSLITALSTRHPVLKSVNLSFSDGVPCIPSRRKACQFISRIVHKWSKLKKLTVPLVTYAALIELGKLPYLDSLEIEECIFTSDVAPVPVTLDEGFRALHSLRVFKCNTPAESLAILNLLDKSPLIVVRISFEGVLSCADWKDVFLAINQHCNRRILAVIWCKDGCELAEEMLTTTISDMITDDVLSPLLAFPNLSFIQLRVSRGFYFPSPSILADFARRWRKLKYFQLRISENCKALPLSKITVHDLVPFAEFCPDLELLGIPLDASNPPPVDVNTVPGGVIHETRIKTLNVNQTRIKNPGLVAAHLSSIFPSLECININTGYPEMDKEWIQVRELLTLLTSVRRQDRFYYEQKLSKLG